MKNENEPTLTKERLDQSHVVVGEKNEIIDILIPEEKTGYFSGRTETELIAAHPYARIIHRSQWSPTRADPTPLAPGVTLQTCPRSKRTRLRFDRPPPDAVRSDLRRHGFIWNQSHQAWSRFASTGAEIDATEIVARHRDAIEEANR